MNIGHVRLFAAALAAFVIFGTAQAQEKLRFIMVTHGAASDPFWATIKERRR